MGLRRGVSSVTLSRSGVLRHRDREEREDRPVPDLDDGPHEWPEDAPEDHRVLTEGVTTDVWREDRSRVGHILMAEWDDIDDPSEPLMAAEDAPGPAVVLRSSPGCYHLWDLLVRPTWDGMVEEVREVSGEPDWVEERIRHERFVLRTAAKVRESDLSTYKPAPEPVYATFGDGPVSRPHLTKLLQMCDRAGSGETAERLAVVEEREETVGQSFATQAYQSMTDELAEVW